ncbi:MAG: hypothetical protein ACI9YT_001264 [Halobacteriales archaeon]|jgi:hypothetical protein
MPFDIENHPESPSLDELGEFIVEPVPPEEIQARRDRGEVLVETNLMEHEEVDAYVELGNPEQGVRESIGTVLYRLVQLFGTPQFPEFRAGTDISDRTDTTFKYLLEVSENDTEDSPREWLITVHDWHVRLGVSLAEWSDDPGDRPSVERSEAIVLLALVNNAVTEPVECEYEDKFF